MTQPASLVSAARPCRQFTVSQNARGQWVAREGAGLIEGVFRSQRDAVRFALYEIGRPEAVAVVAGGPPLAPGAQSGE